MHRTKVYGNSGHRWAREVYGLAQQSQARTVLDYGCGQGSLFAAIREQMIAQPELPFSFECIEYDPAISGKNVKPLRADVVACTDVLEHIEPEFLDDVLDDIHNIARVAVFLVVSTMPAKKHLPDGRNAHLIVEPSRWWLRKILDRWNVSYFKSAPAGFLCVGEPF